VLVFGFDRRDKPTDFLLLGIRQILLRAFGIHVKQVENVSAGDDVVDDARAPPLLPRPPRAARALRAPPVPAMTGHAIDASKISSSAAARSAGVNSFRALLS